ncbi:MAG: 1-acylglycerol-3-phosphate O-acyltransferase, partial [Pseudonocardiales bacterium]|nr:1-acylglycerol-3-phosphate O-acyltransferase [Pseudonocardiales bacterium]
LAFRPKVLGAENVPRQGPVIVAANHLSSLDTLFIAVLLRRRVTFIAKAEYFSKPGVRGRAMAALMAACGFIPLDRSSASAAKAAMTTGLRVLAEGGVLGVYPEGTRSPDGRLYRGRTGIARLALESGAPVVPVGLVGTREVLPPDRRIPRLRSIKVKIAAPLSFSRGDRSPNDQALLRSATDEVMTAILGLSGQQRADGYAPASRGA